MSRDHPDTTRIRVIGEALREADKETATLRAALQDRKSHPENTGRRYAPLVRAAKLVLAADAMCAKEAPGCDRGWDMAMEELRRAVKGLKQ